jgi:LmbE family N-acetylglucosaminyl deacetylase
MPAPRCRRFAVFFLVLVATAAGTTLAGRQSAAPAPDALEPASTGGLEVVDRALAKLSGHRRLLMIGAHPDDEDTTLLAWVSRQLGGEAAYLALTRGEGGQNLIGSELGTALGLLRSEELLAARRVDGARQYFTRAVDFGYTRSLTETFERWPREEVLLDAVRVARRFKPQVLVSVFPNDDRGGHGQHQAAGVVAYDLWRVSTEGEPDLFPQLEEEGLARWRPEALYRAAWWASEEATLELALTGLEPLSGRSIRQIAAASRGRHRSQDMGRNEPLGPVEWPLVWEGGGAGEGSTDPFDGIDTRLAALAAPLAAGAQRAEVERLLAAVEETAVAARRALSPVALESAVQPLVEIVVRLRAAAEIVSGLDEGGAGVAVAELIEEKVEVAEAGLLAAAGIAFDARADRDEILAGGQLGVTLELWNAGEEALTVESLRLEGESGWRPPAVAVESSELPAGALGSWETSWTTGALSATLPYFLERPQRGDLYDWSAAPVETRGEPFERAPLTAVAEVTVRGARVTARRPVVHVAVDQARGELRRPLRVVPPVEVRTVPDLLLWPLADERPRRITVEVVSHLDEPLTASLGLSFAGRGVLPMDPLPIEIPEPGGRAEVPLELPPPGPMTGSLRLVARVTLEGPRSYGRSVPLVDYPHIRPRARPVQAEATIRLLDVELPELRAVGYVRGASDGVPEVLRELGVPVELLPAETLATTDLSRFDVVVVGSRAYEVEPALGRATGRLLEWVENGGTMLVQYQQYQFVDGGFAPAGLTIDRPHGRATDEAAPVRVLAPDHPVLARPNRIGPEDWRGWVQERGLYFAARWEEPFVPLLALRDPGEEEQSGALLVAEMGEGVYVYTGLAFFRQLPAGVPGAVRLFANLLALGGGVAP